MCDVKREKELLDVRMRRDAQGVERRQHVAFEDAHGVSTQEGKGREGLLLDRLATPDTAGNNTGRLDNAA